MSAQETREMNVDAPAQALTGTMDVDEFMAFLETRPEHERWDLIEGVAVMMAPPSHAHQLIVYNLCELLNSAIRVSGRDMFACPGAGVRNPGLRNFQPIPDVVVIPGRAGHDLYSERFLLVTEVLSPSNTRTEIDLKLRRYREAPDNLYAAVIEPREFFVEVHSRARDWQPTKLIRPDEVIEMPEFGLRCQVVDLYRGTVLDPQRT
jgi:Uma2 family endonuclease